MTRQKITTLLVVLVVLMGAGQAVAAGPGADAFVRTEFHVLGPAASGSWHAQVERGSLGLYQIGGQSRGDAPSEFGSPVDDDEEQSQGPSRRGDQVKAALYSAVFPGAGQYFNGQKKKAYIMGGVEVAIWTAFFVFDKQGDNKRDDSREWSAIYAGTSGDHEERYWQNVGGFANSDDYNTSLLRESRATGEELTGLVSGADAWEWVNDERRLGYTKLRADGNSAYDRRDFMILFAVLNRTVSMVDAVIGVGKKDGVLEAEVLGLNLEMEMLPSFRDPGGRFVISRSF